MESKNTYDFVIVGGGPAGCTVAAGLAKSAQRPKVLLLEAGGRNDDKALRVNGKRWTTLREPSMNWGYRTTPQEYCNGHDGDYSRGKGLGGSSAINFGVFAIGARDDYDEWASEVDDDTFGWKEMHIRYKNLETFDGRVLPKNQKYVRSVASDHGHSGPLRVGYAQDWERDLAPTLDAFEAAGHKLNLDHNSGNPLGMAATINSAWKGERTTAVDMFENVPHNLVVVTDSPVQRVLLEGKKAVGVEAQGTKYFASRDVILSAGTLDTPKILMHSGIGPAKELEKFNISVVNDLPAIGQGLRDHYLVPLVLARNPETNDRNSFFKDPAAMEAAMKEWLHDNTGLWNRYCCQIGTGWFKSDRITASPEFKALPTSVQEFLNRETIPHYEIATHMPLHCMKPEMFKDYSYSCLVAFMINEQSRGEVHLQSSDPDIPLLFDPRFLGHPYDRRACIEIYRHLLDVSRQECFAKDTISTLMGPASDSDEDILEFWKNTLCSSWHMTGTVKMGKTGASDAAVDTRFRVRDMENLRVADMSVVPVLTNNHTQATAYVTGITCADILIKEYDLDKQ
ncbi:CAZyme family AA3 [Penicillium roqueforti]|uniref:Glucose-methanol-choline oxidoreductase n=1 Tax=Penicillium roqueforti (strain FM164) TaxID=1365484 RepID=W6QE12_PENRF|nr:CAZyme family AA3 [Penicillium roqueforti]CDM34256.1 Glucose-methanol-choline oxidoreductase [Penicillium roqueforti FM164]KAI2744638.1 CAZyme family AA3 [Penicillium roqueforti]KAI2769817.1 CAZyme family AA3 [Penicillium roqueforti]KAI3068851.1 CAZyme family AA3 [Penicillium roqueforti]